MTPSERLAAIRTHLECGDGALLRVDVETLLAVVEAVTDFFDPNDLRPLDIRPPDLVYEALEALVDHGPMTDEDAPAAPHVDDADLHAAARALVDALPRCRYFYRRYVECERPATYGCDEADLESEHMCDEHWAKVGAKTRARFEEKPEAPALRAMIALLERS